MTSIKKYYRINAGENMFECTQIACEETIRDLKKVDYLRIVTTQLIFLFHTISLIVKCSLNTVAIHGIIVYSILTVVTLCYLITFICVVDYKNGCIKPKYVKITGNTLKWIKRAVSLYSIGMTVSAICFLYTNVSPLSIITAALMIVALIMQILFDVLIKIFGARLAYIIDAVKADVNVILKPVDKVLNTFGKGRQEVEPNLNQKKLLLKAEGLKKEKNRIKREKNNSEKNRKKQKIKGFFRNIFKKKKNEETSDPDFYYIDKE